MTSEALGNPETELASRLRDGASYRRWSTLHPFYLPWEDKAALGEHFDDIQTLSLNDPARLYYLAAFARQASSLSGAFGECGVFRGGSALLIARVTAETGAELHLIDSFDGLSEPDVEKDAFYQRGDFRFGDPDAVRGLLAEAGERVNVHEGWIPEILDTLPERRWAFVHLDLDLYHPTLGACNYFYDRTVRGGIMLFDEYGFASCRGERDAVDFFFSDKPERPIVLPTGQAFIIRL